MNDFADRIGSILPTDETPASLNQSLARLALERDAAAERLAELQKTRARALLDPHSDIGKVEVAQRDVSLLIERLDTLRPELEKRLAAAEEAAAAELRTRERLGNQATEALAKYRAAMGEYPPLAERIVQICRLSEAAESAVRNAVAYGWTPPPPPVSLARTVILPNLEGGLLWGRTPASGPLSPRSLVYS